MAIDPNIALGVKPLELVNPLAQYGMVSQIQHAQNQNRLADMQMQEYQRTRMEEDAARNFLKGRDLTAPETVSGLAQFGKTGLAYGKELSGQRKTNLETEAAQFKLANDKLKHGWQSMGEASTPQAAIEKLNDGVKNGYFDMKTASAEIQKLQNMAPEEYKAYRVEKIMGLLDAKDQLAAVLPKITRQEAGGQILNIQDNPALPGYGLPVQGMAPIKKTATIADTIAQGRLDVEKGRLAQEATGVVYQEDANGNVVALPSKLKKGEVPVGRVAVAPGAGFQPLQGKPSEAVGKEQMSINQQKAIVKGAIEAVTATPDAFGMVRGMTPESLGGRMASPEQNQARSYLFNVVSGVIKERAGTAQSAAEADTLRRFLPVETDDAQVIKDKMIAFDKYLSAKESGTTKKRGGSTAPTMSPVDQQALQWANSNPADPRAAAIKQRLGM